MTRNNILSTLFLIIGISLVLSGNCYSQTATISLDLKNKTILEVFHAIEQSSA